MHQSRFKSADAPAWKMDQACSQISAKQKSVREPTDLGYLSRQTKYSQLDHCVLLNWRNIFGAAAQKCSKNKPPHVGQQVVSDTGIMWISLTTNRDDQTVVTFSQTFVSLFWPQKPELSFVSEQIAQRTCSVFFPTCSRWRTWVGRWAMTDKRCLEVMKTSS